MTLDVWIDDSHSKMKLPFDNRFSEAVQIFAVKEKDKIKLDELSRRLVETVDEMNTVLRGKE